MKRWIGFGIGFSMIFLVVWAVVVFDSHYDDRQYAREQAAIERALAQERLVAQRQQYDQERWQLTLVALSNVGEWLDRLLPLLLTGLLIFVITRGHSVSLSAHSFKMEEDDDDENDRA